MNDDLNCLERSGHDKIEVQSRNLAGGTEENYQKRTVTEVSFSVEIQTQDVSITSVARYCYVTLFVYKIYHISKQVSVTCYVKHKRKIDTKCR
jgi:hypothetical protein